MTATNVTVPFLEQDPELAHRWSAEKAEAWMKEAGWLVGCNYVPGNAINQLEMWQKSSFSPALIDRELGWAASLGFNTVRVFLHHLLWEENAHGFLQRIDEYLAIAHKHGIRTMFVLFDAVWNPFPKLGKQPQPKHNVHNSGWVQCPGYDVLNNPANYDSLHSYVHGIVSHFKADERVLIWDLYNEPDNMNLASYKDDDYIVHKAELSMALLRKAINWVRAINPSQPITMAPWQNDWSCDTKITALDNYMFSHSDIVSFHCYENKSGMEARIQDVKRYGRPMLCTEYMARPFGNTFQEILPLFKKYGIGAYNWGLVAGKTQTHCPWDSWQVKYESEPELWFHDIFRENGEPYILEEVEYLRTLLNVEKESLQEVA
ncbi:cellulase family glycosylhydrolase [Flavisolibacter ginsenosidimutans]|uniref:Glycoside hydrolase family 5 protein n=1 Tax=Flavisolibacter ginsenosidimutans TaxID=661481 RepID=A0A5B8UGQ2_9BACT|nr:cellulase family glycosylhydrolase [Flavisolibacter ginsenosidimutans]QEC55841.1 glycoside hydrolase family 5 protein [Flavisolibacter ginsenosidimutans]